MKKFILSFFVIGGFALYAIYYGSGGTLMYIPNSATSSPIKNKGSAIATNAKNNRMGGNLASVQNKMMPKQNTATTTGRGMMNAGTFRDGEYVGDSVDAYYGYIQVKAVIANGKLSDVIFLDYPQDRGNSIRINNYAMPILKTEAIASQNSNVNTVSGATDSSGAFRQSLASALVQAKI